MSAAAAALPCSAPACVCSRLLGFALLCGAHSTKVSQTETIPLWLLGKQADPLACLLKWAAIHKLSCSR